jgi:hypothetical protein
MIDPMFPIPHNAEFKGATDVKWFAGLAMQAIIQRQGIPQSDSMREEIALWAVRMGQAMAAADDRLHASEDD